MSVQLAIHPFETLINHRSLRFAVFRELLETSLKDRTGILKSAPDRSQLVQVPSVGSISRSQPVHGGRALIGSVQGEAPPDTGRSRQTRTGMSRHRVPAKAPHRTSSLPGIQACGFGRLKYQFLPTQLRCPFPPRKPERAAGSAHGNDCKASRRDPLKCDEVDYFRYAHQLVPHPQPVQFAYQLRHMTQLPLVLGEPSACTALVRSSILWRLFRQLNS
jgi:hypothetical protein